MAKTQSLAAQSGALQNTQLKLPACFSPPTAPMEARFIAPYITFAHPKRLDEWKKLTGQFGNIEEGDMYFISKEHTCKLDPAKLGLLCFKQYWALANPAGEVQKVSFVEMPHPYKEHVQCVVLVYLEDRIVPANVEFRTTKCGAAKTLSDALLEAATPAWADKGPAYKETLVANQPFMRFYGEVTLGPTRTSKTSGLPYKPASCVVKPTNLTEWRLLKVLCDEPATQKALDDAAQRFEFKVKELEAKAK